MKLKDISTIIHNFAVVLILLLAAYQYYDNINDRKGVIALEAINKTKTLNFIKSVKRIMVISERCTLIKNKYPERNLRKNYIRLYKYLNEDQITDDINYIINIYDYIGILNRNKTASAKMLNNHLSYKNLHKLKNDLLLVGLLLFDPEGLSDTFFYDYDYLLGKLNKK